MEAKVHPVRDFRYVMFMLYVCTPSFFYSYTKTHSCQEERNESKTTTICSIWWDTLTEMGRADRAKKGIKRNHFMLTFPRECIVRV